MTTLNASAGPSKARMVTPSKDLQDKEEEEEGDEDRMDLGTLQSFADKIQRRPIDDEDLSADGSIARAKIVIPKRGEKDFEPMKETVNLQEMMLQRSREALFGALTGVRGGNSKTMSHALLSPSQSYPKMIIARGHLLDTMGIAVRESYGSEGKAKTYTELLPEEALYLLERGSLQIWVGPSAESSTDGTEGTGEWSDAEYGIKGAVEMSVPEAFATFIGQDDLSWERYQSYAYLKRLGYTVQRTRRFLPTRFHQKSSHPRPNNDSAVETLPPFRTWWLSIPVWTHSVFDFVLRRLFATSRYTNRMAGASSVPRLQSSRRSGFGWIEWLTYPRTYQSILRSLSFVPTSHSLPTPDQPSKKDLQLNPYLPFWHVWKPATAWSKGTWDRASESGLVSQRPEYIVAVVNSRDTPLPSLAQLSQVFDELPDEPKGPVKKLGPQYQRQDSASRDTKRPNASFPLSSNWLHGIFDPKAVRHSGPNMGALRNGDRALIVAVNDSGNTGWVRFGRTAFADHAIV